MLEDKEISLYPEFYHTSREKLFQAGSRTQLKWQQAATSASFFSVSDMIAVWKLLEEHQVVFLLLSHAYLIVFTRKII